MVNVGETVRALELAQDDVPQPGMVLCGKYELLDELGSGGFGRVYLARHIQLGTNVALKLGHTRNDSAALVKEARLAAGLSSPHSVRILDVDRAADGRPYIVMEYLQGCTLREYLASHPAHVSSTVATAWGLEICAALSEAHLRGLVHRDIKPSNLFLVPTSTGSLRVKLVDFGLAKTINNTEDSITDSEVVAGTPAYMAPERLRSNQTSPATDIWSLGVVLFEILTGTTPFEGKTSTAMLAAIIADPPRSLGGLRPDVPADLERVVMRCLRKSPNERYASIEQIALALTACLDSAPREVGATAQRSSFHTCDTTASVVTRRRRNPGVPTLAVVAAVASSAVIFWLYSVSSQPQQASISEAEPPTAISAAPSSPSPTPGETTIAKVDQAPNTLLLAHNASPSTTPSTNYRPSVPVSPDPIPANSNRAGGQRIKKSSSARSAASVPRGLIMDPEF